MKTKALILASSHGQFRNLCRNFNMNPMEYQFVRNWHDMCGWWIDKPVIILNGYQYNSDYTLGLMTLIGHRFDNIGFLSEGEIWNESPSI